MCNWEGWVTWLTCHHQLLVWTQVLCEVFDPQKFWDRFLNPLLFHIVLYCHSFRILVFKGSWLAGHNSGIAFGKCISQIIVYIIFKSCKQSKVTVFIVLIFITQLCFNFELERLFLCCTWKQTAIMEWVVTLHLSAMWVSCYNLLILRGGGILAHASSAVWRPPFKHGTSRLDFLGHGFESHLGQWCMCLSLLLLVFDFTQLLRDFVVGQFPVKAKEDWPRLSEGHFSTLWKIQPSVIIKLLYMW